MESQKVEMPQKEIYYFPFLTIRTWPSLELGLKELRRSLKYKEQIEVYKSYLDAQDRANRMLFDDDASGIICIEIEDGKCYAWFDEKEKVELSENIKDKLRVLGSDIEAVYFYPYPGIDRYSRKESAANHLKQKMSSEENNIEVYSDLFETYKATGLTQYDLLGIEIKKDKCIGWCIPYTGTQFEIDKKIIERISVIDTKSHPKTRRI